MIYESIYFKACNDIESIKREIEKKIYSGTLDDMLALVKFYIPRANEYLETLYNTLRFEKLHDIIDTEVQLQYRKPVQNEIDYHNNLVKLVTEYEKWISKIKKETGFESNEVLLKLEKHYNKVQIPQDLNTQEAQEIFKKAIGVGLMEYENGVYKWCKSKRLYGYFVERVTEKLEIRHNNNRIPWQKFSFVANHKEMLRAAKEAINDYKNKRFSPPEGDDIVNNILK